MTKASEHLGEGQVGSAPRGSLAPRHPSLHPSLPLSRRYLCQGSDSGFCSRAGSGPGRSPRRPARREYLLSLRVFLCVQVAVSLPSMLSSDRRDSGSRRPRGDPAPLMSPGDAAVPAGAGAGSGTAGGEQGQQRGPPRPAPGQP